MIQVSGTFGSRQEEAQRLGRILRPKEGEPARFLHSGHPRHPRDGLRPSPPVFLTEQGYSYEILDESDIAKWVEDDSRVSP